MKQRKGLRWSAVTETGKTVRRKMFAVHPTQKLLIWSEVDPFECINHPNVNPINISTNKRSTESSTIGRLCLLLLKFCFDFPSESFIIIFRACIIFLSFQLASNFFATITKDDTLDNMKSMIISMIWKRLIGLGFSFIPVRNCSASRRPKEYKM